MNCQIVHDSWHTRGFTDISTLRLDGRVVGYGAVGGDPGQPKDTIKEFFVDPADRGSALTLLRAFITATGAEWIETQTNDPLLSVLIFDCADDLTSTTILFEDALTSTIPAPDGAVRRLTDAERAAAFPHTLVPVGDWGVEAGGAIVATGGFFLHYNPPFADLYMEVAPPARRRGYGSYLIQELKRVCYQAGRVPAARCAADNTGSRLTLQRAGLLPSGRIVRGRVKGASSPAGATTESASQTPGS